MLTQIAAGVLSTMQDLGLPAALLAWITLHREGAEYAHLFTEEPVAFMTRIADSPIQEDYPHLLKQANAIIADRYPNIS
jgi:hypothetical protein